MENMRIDRSIASILLFRIDISLFSENIGLSSKSTKVEADNKIELEQVSEPSCLLAVFEILVIYDNVDRKGGTF